MVDNVTMLGIVVEKRKLLNETLRERGLYPNVLHPGDCYIFDVVLGIDPRTVALQPITRKSYKALLHNPDGSRVLHKGQVVAVTRLFTPKQRKALHEWWYLLSPEVRGELA